MLNYSFSSLLSNLSILVNQVSDLVGKIVCNLNLSSHLNPMVLQVQICTLTKEDLSINDCVIFSRQLEDALDNSSLLSSAYVLEVGSPGISEELFTDRDFLSFRGFPVEVVFFKTTNSSNCRQGLLLERNEESILINVRGRIHRIPRNQVTSVQLINPSDQT
uniref:Ribosome maturation factor RimP N-terminal domain-containing protein n=1 Tax=Paulinella longichromatophora TaxID=1708747 RepID=A0A2H4ZP08_9EUKA|nr:hypothetical protein PLO_251 [Paulinella longichromatophora]